MSTNSVVKILVGIGALALVSALIVWLLGKTGIPFGKMPGDIHVSGEKSSFSFPIVTCLIISAILTVLINIALFFFRK